MMEGSDIIAAEAIIDNGRFGKRTVRSATGRPRARGGGAGLRPPAGSLRGDERGVRRRGARLGRDVRAHGRAHRGPGLGPLHLPPGVAAGVICLFGVNSCC